MLLAAAIFNLLVGGLDLILLRFVARTRRPWQAFLGLVLAGGAMLFFTMLLGGGSFFFTLRLLAYGVFLHGTLVLAGLGVLFRRAHRRAAAAAAAGAVALAATAFFAFAVEPFRLEVSRVRLESPRVTRPVRIAVLADLQTDEIGAYEVMVLRRLMEARPDILLLAGDYFQAADRHEKRLRERFGAAWREAGLAAPLGVFAVRGNVDGGDWPRIFDGLGVRAFEATGSAEAGELKVTGLSFDDGFNPSFALPVSEKFHVVFAHAPDFALGDVRADLLVAGHTHGGQVRLPGIGPLVTMSRVPRAWAAGVTKLEGGRTLVVSRGVGMERGGAPRLRFLCRPEIVVIDVVPAPAR